MEKKNTELLGGGGRKGKPARPPERGQIERITQELGPRWTVRTPRALPKDANDLGDRARHKGTKGLKKKKGKRR